MVNGKAPITRCENVAKHQTMADIDKPTVTVIDVAFKAWVDQWLHLAKASGEYDRIAARWLR